MITTARQLKDLIRNMSKKKSADAQILMRNYMMERFLERISLSEYKNQFILKGGMLVAAMVGLDARATMDLDATIKGTNVSVEDVEMIISQIISIPLDDGVSFRVKRISEIMEEADYPGVRVSMETKFDGVITPLKIDISTGDVITPTILFLIYLALLVWIILFKLQFSISDLDKVRSINLIPFHYDKEIGAAFHLTEVLENFLIFVPMGIYLQMILPRTKLYVKFMLIAGTSFLLETMQYILAVGRSDITDVLTNTAGGLLGLAVYSMAARLIGNRIKANRLFSILAGIVSVVVIGLLGLLLFANR